MKRILTALLLLSLLASLLTGCTMRENPPNTYIVHDGQLWKVPTETVGIALPEDAELIECTRISLDVMPTRENECNYTHGTVQVYDGGGFFLVIIDGKQHLIERERPAGSNASYQVDPDRTYVFYNGALWEVDPEVTDSMNYDEQYWEQYWDEFEPLTEGAELIDAILIDPDEIPSKELECNARTDRARIYIAPNGSITVVLGVTGHLTTRK